MDEEKKEPEKEKEPVRICKFCGYLASKDKELEDHIKDCENNRKTFRPRGSGGAPLGAMGKNY